MAGSMSLTRGWTQGGEGVLHHGGQVEGEGRLVQCPQGFGEVGILLEERVKQALWGSQAG